MLLAKNNPDLQRRVLVQSPKQQTEISLVPMSKSVANNTALLSINRYNMTDFVSAEKLEGVYQPQASIAMDKLQDSSSVMPRYGK